MMGSRLAGAAPLCLVGGDRRTRRAAPVALKLDVYCRGAAYRHAHARLGRRAEVERHRSTSKAKPHRGPISDQLTALRKWNASRSQDRQSSRSRSTHPLALEEHEVVPSRPGLLLTALVALRGHPSVYVETDVRRATRARSPVAVPMIQSIERWIETSKHPDDVGPHG